MMARPDSNYHPIVLIKSILETQTMKRTEKKENVVWSIHFIFSWELNSPVSCLDATSKQAACSVMNTGDYSEVYANVWWMWCSVPIKIFCHAAQTTGIHNHWELHLSKASLAVNQIQTKSDRQTNTQPSLRNIYFLSWTQFFYIIRWYLDMVTMRGKYSPKTILIYESLSYCAWCWQSVPLWGVMSQSRHQADGPRGLGRVTRS